MIGKSLLVATHEVLGILGLSSRYMSMLPTYRFVFGERIVIPVIVIGNSMQDMVEIEIEGVAARLILDRLNNVNSRTIRVMINIHSTITSVNENVYNDIMNTFAYNYRRLRDNYMDSQGRDMQQLQGHNPFNNSYGSINGLRDIGNIDNAYSTSEIDVPMTKEDSYILNKSGRAIPTVEPDKEVSISINKLNKRRKSNG